MLRSYLCKQGDGEAVSHLVRDSQFPEERNSLASGSRNWGDPWATREGRGLAPALAASPGLKLLQALESKSPSRWGRNAGRSPGPNSLHSELTPGLHAGARRGAGGGPGFHSLQSLNFSVPGSKPQSRHGQMDFPAETAGFSTVGHVETYPQAPEPLTVALEDSDLRQTSTGPPFRTWCGSACQCAPEDHSR